jgi:hypothetical protein
MSAAAQRYPRRAGVSLQISCGMAPTGVGTPLVSGSLHGALVRLSTPAALWSLFKPASRRLSSPGSGAGTGPSAERAERPSVSLSR